MAYVTSNNLKSALKIKNPTYLFADDKDTYFCGECRQLFQFKGKIVICPHCGHKGEIKHRHRNPGTDYYIEDAIDGVTINKNYNDLDNSIKDINITLLCRLYKYETISQKQVSWQRYHRMTLNFETNQVYYTTKQLLSKKVDFAHFLLHNELATRESMFSPAIQDAIREIYSEYGIVTNNSPTWANNTPRNMRSPAVAFMCLKFPIMMNYAYDLYAGYAKRIKTKCAVDIHFAIIYWACNYDRVLKKALTSTTEQDYIARTDEILGKFVIDDATMIQIRYNPLYVVYARYMYHLGFRNFNSVKRIVELMSLPDIHKDDISVFILDLLCKRSHVRNKMYKRLFKMNSEDVIIDIIMNCKLKCKYRTYFDFSSEKVAVNNFYQQMEANMVDYSLGEIFNDFINMCNNA